MRYSRPFRQAWNRMSCEHTGMHKNTHVNSGAPRQQNGGPCARLMRCIEAGLEQDVLQERRHADNTHVNSGAPRQQNGGPCARLMRCIEAGLEQDVLQERRHADNTQFNSGASVQQDGGSWARLMWYNRPFRQA
jgi:hypothetical protein